MTPFITLLLALIQGAIGWGDLGHRTVVALATKYLTHEETAHLYDLIGEDDLTTAGIWADKLCSESTSNYTCPWHYINVNDHPPARCGVDVERDHNASSHDIFTAFTNHTAIARGRTSSKADRRDAMKFLFHWVADVHQPLHVEGFGRGGVDLPVLFDGQSTSLHAVWDFKMIEKYRGNDASAAAAYAWADELYWSGLHYVHDRELDCAAASPMGCILHWANEANRAICEVVFEPGLVNIINHDLAAEYYTHSIATVNLQISRAGRRLATWIKLILAEHTLPPQSNIQVLGGAALH